MCVCVCLNTGLCVMYVEDYVCVFMSTIVRTGGGLRMNATLPIDEGLPP